MERVSGTTSLVSDLSATVSFPLVFVLGFTNRLNQGLNTDFIQLQREKRFGPLVTIDQITFFVVVVVCFF